MCFRPSAVEKKDVQMANCPTCGMPVAEHDIANGTCPYCGNPISPQPPNDFSQIDPSYSTRIL